MADATAPAAPAFAAKRFTLGAGFSFAYRKAPAPAAPVDPANPVAAPKLDAAVALVAVKDGVATLNVPAYDLGVYNRLVEVRAYLIPSGTALGSDPNFLLKGPFPYSTVDVSTHQEGVSVDLPLPADKLPADTPDGAQFVGQIVQGYDA